MLNYIRAYAQVIGMEPEEAVLRFEEIDKTLQTNPPPAALERERKKRALVQLAVVIAALAAGGAALLHFASLR